MTKEYDLREACAVLALMDSPSDVDYFTLVASTTDIPQDRIPACVFELKQIHHALKAQALLLVATYGIERPTSQDMYDAMEKITWKDDGQGDVHIDITVESVTANVDYKIDVAPEGN